MNPHAYPPEGTAHPFEPYRPAAPSDDEVLARGEAVLARFDARRSVRMFSTRPVPRRAVELAVAAASTAPSGAHQQPWTFVLVGDPTLKAAIREAAEAEERENYEGGRLPDGWREALEPLGTDWRKPFLERVPWIVVLFEQRYGVADDGSRVHHYYVKESVGIAAGLFVAAVHEMGLATLPHTPSPMAFLREVLGRPEHERPFALFPIGFPAADCVVPALGRKPLDEVLVEVAAT
ncbi:MAG: nitroreductase family protein [Acidimicrobiia bacterium]